MSNTTKILGDEAGIQVSDIFIKESDLDEVKYQGLIAGKFRRGRTDKPMTITPQNINSVLGYDPLNRDYQIILDAFEQGVSSVIVYRLTDNDFSIEPNELSFTELSVFQSKLIFGTSTVNDELRQNGFYGALTVYAKQSQTNSIEAQLYIKTQDYYDYVDNIEYNNFDILYLQSKLNKFDHIINLDNHLNKIKKGSLLSIGRELCFVYDINGDNFYIKRGLGETIPNNHELNTRIIIRGDNGYAIDGFSLGQDYFFKSLPIVNENILDLADAIEYKFRLKNYSSKPYPPKNVKINDKSDIYVLKGSLLLSWNNRSRYEDENLFSDWYEDYDNIENGIHYVVELIDAKNNLKETYIFYPSDHLGVYIDYSNIDTTTFKLSMYSVLGDLESEQRYEHLINIDFNPPYNLRANWDGENRLVNLTWDFE